MGERQRLSNVFVLKLRIFPFEFSPVGVGGERLKHSPYRQAKITYAWLAIMRATFVVIRSNCSIFSFLFFLDWRLHHQ